MWRNPKFSHMISDMDPLYVTISNTAKISTLTGEIE